MQPTAQQIWQAAIVDPKFAGQMPEGSPQRAAIQPFIEGSANALSDQFEKTVTLEAIVDAKLQFLRYCIENNLGKAMSEVTGMDASTINNLLKQLVSILEPIVEDIVVFLEKNGVTEEQVMTSSKVGLNAENLQRFHDGTLTIGQLLLTQPTVILQNDS